MSCGDVVKAGYLTKSPPERPGIGKVAQWHRRWFVLSDSSLVYPLARRCVQLAYFHCEEDTRKMKDPKGVIDLCVCIKVESQEPIKNYKYVFDVCTGERTYHLAAETSQEKEEWIKTLSHTLFSSGPSLPIGSQRSKAEVRRSQEVSGTHFPQQGPPNSQERRRPARPISYAGDCSALIALLNQSRPLPPLPVGDQVTKRPLPPTPSNAETVIYKRPPCPLPGTSSQPHRMPQKVNSEEINSTVSKPTIFSPVPAVRPALRKAKPLENGTAKSPVFTRLSGGNNSTLESNSWGDYSHLEHATDGGGRDRSTLEPRAMERNGEDYSYLEYTTEGDGPQDPPVTAADDRDYSTLRPSANVEGGECYGRLGYAREGGHNVEPVEPPIRRVGNGDHSTREPSATGNGGDYSVLQPPTTPPVHSATHHYSRLELDRARNLLPRSPPKTKDYENLACVAQPDDGDYSHLVH